MLFLTTCFNSSCWSERLSRLLHSPCYKWSVLKMGNLAFRIIDYIWNKHCSVQWDSSFYTSRRGWFSLWINCWLMCNLWKHWRWVLFGSIYHIVFILLWNMLELKVKQNSVFSPGNITVIVLTTFYENIPFPVIPLKLSSASKHNIW